MSEELDLRIELFGSLRLRRADGSMSEIAPQRPGALLALLALRADRQFAREEVIELLWPGLDIESGRSRLRRCLYTLKSDLSREGVDDADVLVASRFQIGLAQNVEVDTRDFERVLASAVVAADLQDRIRLLCMAVKLYRGDLLPGFYDEPFGVERERLADVYRSALVALTDAYRQSGDLTRASDCAGRVIALDPLSEEAHRDAIRLFLAAGRQSEAIRQFRSLESSLVSELGIEPSDETRALIQTILNGERSASRRNAGTSDAAAPNAGTVNDGNANGGYGPTVAPQAPFEAPAHPIAARAESRPPEAYVARPSANSRNGSRLTRRLAIGVTIVIGVLGMLTRDVIRQMTSGAGSTTAPAVAVPSNTAPISVQTEYGKESWYHLLEPAPGDTSSEGTAISVTPNGTSYVTGFVHSRDHDVDFITIKYSPAGKMIWQRRYNGPANDCDRARSIAVDGDENVYVTGDSYGGDREKGGTDWDVATVKYDKTGRQIWVRRYDSGAKLSDMGKKVVVDGSGDIYVGATSVARASNGSPRSDMLLLKYDPEGNLLWQRRFSPDGRMENDLCDLTLDASGLPYVTGGSREVITVKYDSKGAVVWKSIYAGPIPTGSSGRRIVTDSSSNVYVAADVGIEKDYGGKRIAALKYDAMGVLRWIKMSPDGTDAGSETGALALLPRGGPIVIGADCSYDKLMVAFYNESGIAVPAMFSAMGSQSGSWDQANSCGMAVAVGHTGNTYVAGRLSRVSAASETILLTFGPDLNLVRRRQFHLDGALYFLAAIGCSRQDQIVGVGRASDHMNKLLVVSYLPL